MKTVALDDEPVALDIISRYAAECLLIQKIDCFTQVQAAQEFLQSTHVDLLFLDIQMPSTTGIEFYKSLPKKPLLIFCTSHSNYALEGFELAATDYLLKPFTYDRFYQAVEKACRQLQASSLVNDYIEIKEDGFVHFLPTASILYVEALDNYVKIFALDSKPIISRITLKQIGQQLPNNVFIKIHRSYIVSVQHVKAHKTGTVIVADQMLPVSKSAERKIAAVLSLKTQ